jgi:hypothetical protein
MVKYSYRALYMKYEQGSWIELCNNDCGTMVFFDKEKNIVCNAAVESNNCVHKDVCDFLKDLRQGARAFNWYPSFAIDQSLLAVFLAADKAKESQDELYQRVEELKTVMELQREMNKEEKMKWDRTKQLKLQLKKDTERAYEREQDQIMQWKRYGEPKKDQQTTFQQSPQFTTADRL